MVRWKKEFNRFSALSMAVVLAGTSADVSALAAENTDAQIEQTVETDFEENESEESAQAEKSDETEVAKTEEITEEETIEEETFETIETETTVDEKESDEEAEASEIVETETTIDANEAEETVSVVNDEDYSSNYEDEIDTRYYFGSNYQFFWSYDSESKTLTIERVSESGTGDLPSYNGESRPWTWSVSAAAIEKVVIEDGVTKIGNSMFCEYSQLKEVLLPDSVAEIGSYAFCECDKLETINLTNVTKIGDSAFLYTILASVDLQNLTEIGSSAFTSCKITTVDIPNVTEIQSRVFMGCSNLEEVNIPNVTKIGSRAFERCEKLTSIDLSKVESIGDCAFFKSGLTSVVIPSCTTYVGYSAFFDNRNLNSVTILCSPKFLKKDSGWDEEEKGSFKKAQNITSFTLSCEWKNSDYSLTDYVESSVARNAAKEYVHKTLSDENIVFEKENDSDTMSLKCCNYCEGIPIKFNVPENAVYNGNVYEANYEIQTDSSDLQNITKKLRVDYEKDGSKVLNAIDAGKLHSNLFGK